MNCQFCQRELTESQQGTRMCDNCWEIHHRIANMPLSVLNRIVKHARSHIGSK